MLSFFNILIHEVYRKFDKNCIKTLKIEKIWNFCHFLCNFSFKNRIYFSIECYWTTNSCLVERFQHSISRCLSKKCTKTLKSWKILNFSHFRGHFGSLWGHFRNSQKCPKISTNTYRTMLNLRELNSMDNAF